jgi:hypothetical protein
MDKRKIKFSERLYIYISKTELTLVSLAVGNIQTMRLSTNDAIAIFRSVEAAFNAQEIMQVKTGDLVWTTDARLQAEHPDRMLIKCNGPLGFVYEVVDRKDVFLALSKSREQLRY